VLRLALGAVWAGNLLFVIVPSNNFFESFSATASGFSSSNPTGPGLAEFAAQNGPVFALLVAGTTVYLAVALILGLTTRIACLVGSAFSATLLVAQWGLTFSFPGGTDVGPHPLYLAIYAGLFIGRADQYFSLDERAMPALRRWLSRRRPSPSPNRASRAGSRKRLDRRSKSGPSLESMSRVPVSAAAPSGSYSLKPPRLDADQPRGANVGETNRRGAPAGGDIERTRKFGAGLGRRL
jgi:uncharacterized membrane protein YphA (DoxX/SURF4 family)